MKRVYFFDKGNSISGIYIQGCTPPIVTDDIEKTKERKAMILYMDQDITANDKNFDPLFDQREGVLGLLLTPQLSHGYEQVCLC